MNNHGKRMVQEDELKYLQELKAAHEDPTAEWGGGGSSLEAGVGIDITEGVLSVDYGAGLTVDDGTLVVDTSAVAMKSELATVATTGDYNDLIDIPSIPDAVSGTNDGTNWTTITIGNDTYDIPQGGEQMFTMTSNYMQLTNDETQFILDNYKNLTLYYNDAKFYYSYQSGGAYYFVGTFEFSNYGPNFIRHSGIFYPNSNELLIGDNGEPYLFQDNTTIQYDDQKRELGTIIGGGYSSDNYPISSSNFTLDGSDYICDDSIFTSAILGEIVHMRLNMGWSDGFVNFNNSNSVYWSADYVDNQDDTYTFTMQSDNILATGYNSFVYNTLTGEITATSVKYSVSFYGFLTTNSITYMIIDYPTGAKVIKTVDAKFIPIDGTSITVDSNGKLTATGGSGSSKYLHKVSMWANFGGTNVWFTEDYINSSSTAYTSALDYLADRGYNITDTTQTLTKYLTCVTTGGITAIACNSSNNSIYTTTLSINPSGVISLGSNWAVQTDTTGINDEVIAL